MIYRTSPWSLAALVLCITTALAQDIIVSATAPDEITPALPEAFISYSVEVDNFPGWIGSPSSPNAFTKNMLANIQNAQGSLPYIRIGGSSQDKTNYSASQTAAIVNNGDSASYQYTIGPAYFDYYKTSGTKISQGFDLASLLGDEAASAKSSLEAWSKAACTSLGPYLNVLELGNEPDSYVKQSRNTSTFNAQVYAGKWKAATKYITGACPAFNTSGFMGPSVANPQDGWILDAFQAGLNSDSQIEQVSIHSYMASLHDAATNTLQNTLMNHNTIDSLISAYLYTHKSYLQYTPNAPLIVGEGNSITEGGQPGLSDVFGAALWAFDYILLAAGRGIRRINFHQGVNVFYTAWKDSGDVPNPPITRPVYYGHLAAATMIGSETGDKQILPLQRTDQYEAAYATYVDSELRRLAAVNLVQYNNTTPRGSRDFTFKVGTDEEWTVMRLQNSGPANSNATGATTFNGASCEYNKSSPGVCVQASTKPETTYAVNGSLTVSVQDSEAVVMYVHGTIS